ncbi:hypothetical protein [Streptomyces formicae]|uniref:hypothetical protein n=1 Tax=Streptomyces formicae TaxID=1616117 RepID=UPI00131B196F|nr:hypothetical protein [Streptomyces formicae]
MARTYGRDASVRAEVRPVGASLLADGEVTSGPRGSSRSAGAHSSVVCFTMLHIRDTMNTVSPAGLPDRLKAVGFTEVAVDLHPRSGAPRFRAHKP